VTNSERSFFGHPGGLAVLFLTEMWERFGYYGMRALLILYLTAAAAEGGLGMSTADAGAVYALFTSLVYFLGLPGGWIADRFLGQRKAVLFGGVLIALGYFAMAVPSTGAFYAGLGLVIAGTGLLKPNVSAIVGQLYAPEDERRDAGFSLFYMGINLGAFLGPLVCSWLGEKVDWRTGFAAAGVGMSLGLVVYLAGQRRLGDAGLRAAPVEQPESATLQLRQLALGVILGGVALAGVAAAWGLGWLAPTAESISNAFGIFLILLVLVFFAWLFRTGDWTPTERGRLWAIVALFVAAAFFWGAYEQAGSSLNLFARNATDRTIGGWEFPAGWFQWVPALFVILLAPVFAWLWTRLGSRQPSSPVKFSLGLLSVGAGFLVMVAASVRSAGGAKVGVGWLLATYFFHVVGELCLSPVGLSTVTKLAPARVTGLMMGVWFLAAAVGNYLGGRVAGMYETVSLPVLFGIVAGTTLLAGIVLALASPRVRRLMGGVR
jgi:POT family proton-dependent oligopeptide transporter